MSGQSGLARRLPRLLLPTSLFLLLVLLLLRCLSGAVVAVKSPHTHSNPSRSCPSAAPAAATSAAAGVCACVCWVRGSK